MRALPVRRLATTTLCVTLLLGTAGPAFASQGDADPTRDAIEAVSASPVKAPEPDGDAPAEPQTAVDDLLKGNEGNEGDQKDVLGGVPQVLTGLLNTVLSLLGGSQPKAPAGTTLPQVPAA
ncbi:hypothetical protein AB0H82_02205 [Streptomyces sp. NPDC050732]|uniref:hypothetical protein n=1 Tax=Streptomyces sp. NPDC050732 TaxID=3154632 RepID=UPI00341EE945